MTAPTPVEETEETPVSETPETEGESKHVHWEPDGETEETEPEEPIEGDGLKAETETVEPVGEVTPVRIRAGREEVEITGALMAPEGMYVPKEHVAKVLQQLQRGLHHERTWPKDLQRERMEVKRQGALREVSEAKATLYTKKMEEVFASPESFVAFAENLPHNLALLKMEVDGAETLSRMNAMKQGINLDQPYNQLAGDELRDAAADSMVNTFASLIEKPEIRALIPDQTAEDLIFQRLLKTPSRYIQPAAQDIPEIGVLKGQLVIDLETYEQDILDLARMRGPQLQVQQQKTEKQDRAKQINKAVEQAPTRTPVKPSGAKVPVKNAAEWQKRMMQLARQK